jgi:histidine triad (HIT) family protein
MPEESCEFCKIVSKEAPASIVYEDKMVLAFLDIKPFSKGHTLVIPKNHYEMIYDLPIRELASLFAAAKKTAVAVKSAMSADGISIVQNNGKAADQHIFHIHVHVIPRYSGQLLPKPEEVPENRRERLDTIAKLIKKQLVNRLPMPKE